MKWFWCTAVLVGLVLAGTAYAQFYKYVDQNGNVVFTNDINQVPANQRAAVRSYAEFESNASGVKESPGNAEKSISTPSASGEPSGTADIAAQGDGDSLDAAKSRLEDTKKQLDVEYQALVKEKEALAQEKEKLKSREEFNNHNKRVEAFNQRAAKYETGSKGLRNQVDDYNARVTAENDKQVKPQAK